MDEDAIAVRNLGLLGLSFRSRSELSEKKRVFRLWNFIVRQGEGSKVFYGFSCFALLCRSVFLTRHIGLTTGEMSPG